MTDHLGDANTKAGATPEDSSAVRQKGDAMSEIKRFDIPRNGNEFLHEDPDGEYVQYDDHRAEVERLKTLLTVERGEVATLRDRLWPVTRERDAAQAEAIRLQNVIDHLNFESAELTFERNGARAEVQRLTARLEHAQAPIVPPLPHADESAQQVQGKMDAYVTSLNAELHETREKLARVQAQYDAFAAVTAKTIGQHQRERDDARQQVYRLQQACGQTATNPKGREVGRFGLDGHYLDAMEPERPTDEDIWREGFMRCLNDVAAEDWHAQADLVLATYRKRWPR